MQEKKTVSLVLGSGGARGFAHIGVIHWLEENDFEIKSISGCSIGALVGGIYAAGKLDEFEHWIRAISAVDIVSLLDFSWKKSGFVKGEKIINTLTELVGERLIEDLPIKYTAIAADIQNEKEVWMNSGRLFDAIRASISLPLLFTPFKYNDIELIDGGVLNPVPIAPTFSDDTELTIAVNLGGKVKELEIVDFKSNSSSESPTLFTEKLVEFVSNFKDTSDTQTEKEFGVLGLANQAFDAMQSTISRQKLAAYPADYVIEIARNACGTLDFNMASEMINLGYRQTQSRLKHAKTAL